MYIRGTQTLVSFLQLARQVPKPEAGSPEWILQSPIPTPSPAQGLSLKTRQSLSYMTEGVQVVVCEFQLLERD